MGSVVGTVLVGKRFCSTILRVTCTRHIIPAPKQGQARNSGRGCRAAGANHSIPLRELPMHARVFAGAGAIAVLALSVFTGFPQAQSHVPPQPTGPAESYFEPPGAGRGGGAAGGRAGGAPGGRAAGAPGARAGAPGAPGAAGAAAGGAPNFPGGGGGGRGGGGFPGGGGRGGALDLQRAPRR